MLVERITKERVVLKNPFHLHLHDLVIMLFIII